MSNETFDFQVIDVDSWPRKNHFNFYKNFDDPCFNLCLEIDVSQVKRFAYKNNIPLSSALLYLSSKAINQTHAFKLRLDKNKCPYLIKTVHPSATLLKEDDTFTFCNFTYNDDMVKFFQHAKEQREYVLSLNSLSSIENSADQIFYSIIPWLSFTGYKHARGSTEFMDVPKIVFGKIINQDERALMPISVELHHALADAIDVAKYINTFQKLIDNLI